MGEGLDAQSREPFRALLGGAQREKILTVRQKATVSHVVDNEIGSVLVAKQILGQFVVLIDDVAVVVEQVEHLVVGQP